MFPLVDVVLCFSLSFFFSHPFKDFSFSDCYERMIAHKQKKAKKKRVLSSGQLSTDVTTSEMGLKSISSNCVFDPDYIKELVNDIRKFSHMLLYLKEAILSGLSTVFS